MQDLKELEEWILKLRKEQPFIIVEGKKDSSALEEQGLKNIVVLRGRPIYKVVEEVSSKTKECLILTDLDKEGKMLYSKLKKGLSQRGVRVLDNFRKFLFKTQLRQIEGLSSYLQSHVLEKRFKNRPL